MLQRIQTVYFAICGVLAIIYLLSPVLLIETPVVPTAVKAWEVKEFFSGYFVFLILISGGIAAFANIAAIFLFQYPTTQRYLGFLSLLNMLFCFFFVYYKWSTRDSVYDIIFYYGNIFPFIVIFLNFIAILSVAKDEEDLEDLERLR